VRADHTRRLHSCAVVSSFWRVQRRFMVWVPQPKQRSSKGRLKAGKIQCRALCVAVTRMRLVPKKSLRVSLAHIPPGGGKRSVPGGASGLQIRERTACRSLVGSTPTLFRQFFVGTRSAALIGVPLSGHIMRIKHDIFPKLRLCILDGVLHDPGPGVWLGMLVWRTKWHERRKLHSAVEVKRITKPGMHHVGAR
jgi:hypothetical protein